jgi:hypothetical protein
MLAGPTLVQGDQGAIAGRTEPRPLLAQVVADFQSVRLQDNCTTMNGMNDVVARDKNSETVHSLFKSRLLESHRASKRKSPSRGLSRAKSAANLNPMASTLPWRTLPSATLVDSRWSSSRALNDCPPKLPTEEEDSDDSSPNFGDLAPRSPRKTPQAKASSKASSQPASTGVDKALPPKTVCRASLADARWDSSRSLNDNAPKTPKSPHRQKQKDNHLRALLGIAPPAPPADKAPSTPMRARQSIMTSPHPSESPTCVVTSEALTIIGQCRARAKVLDLENIEARLSTSSTFHVEVGVGSLEPEE